MASARAFCLTGDTQSPLGLGLLGAYCGYEKLSTALAAPRLFLLQRAALCVWLHCMLCVLTKWPSLGAA